MPGAAGSVGGLGQRLLPLCPPEKQPPVGKRLQGLQGSQGLPPTAAPACVLQMGRVSCRVRDNPV